MNVTIKGLDLFKHEKQLEEITEYIKGQFTSDRDPRGEYLIKDEHEDYSIKVKKTGDIEIEINK